MGFNTYPNNPFPPSTDQMGESGGGGGETGALEAIAPEFSGTAQYVAGDLVFYEGQLYRFEEDHDPGEWDSTQVMGTNMSDNMVMLPGDGLQRVVHEFAVKLKSDGGLHFDDNGAIYADHLPDYRLIEHKTRQQWIDGRDVYCKVIDLSSNPVALTHDTWVSTGASASGIDFLIDANVIALTSGEEHVCFKHCEVGIINGDISICMVTSVGARSAEYVTIYYVKTAE